VTVLLLAAGAASRCSFNGDYPRRVDATMLTGVNDTGNY